MTLSLVASAAGALALGQDASFDLLNYHFYNGYALLNWRLDQDLAPAGSATYFNPLVDVVHYLGLRHLSPVVSTTLLGVLQGLNVVLVWAIARYSLGAHSVWLAPLAAFLGASGQNAVSLLGTTYSDNTVSIPALAALLILVGVDDPGRLRVFAAGAAGGAAVGLKLTMAAPQVGLTILAGWIAWRHRRASLLVAFVVGSFSGWALANGWWASAMWRRFGNPFYPFLNGLFQSPYAPLVIRDQRWVAHGLLDWLSPPVDAASGLRCLQEVPMRDARLLLVFLALLAWLVTRLGRASAESSTGWPARGLAVHWLATYGAWLAAAPYYRYAVVLEFLAPLVTLALIAEAWPRRTVFAAPALAALLLVTTDTNPWPRERKWWPFWFNPRLPAQALRPNQLILLPDGYTSFAIPFFPPDSAFIGLWGGSGPAMRELIAARIENHRGPLLLLLDRTSEQDHVLHQWGLEREDACVRVSLGRGNRLSLCPLKRSTTEAQGDPARTMSSSTPMSQRGHRAPRSALSLS